jgi:hypothetical protein
VRIIAKAELTGTIDRILPVLDNSEEILLGNLTNEEEIGWQGKPGQKIINICAD